MSDQAATISGLESFLRLTSLREKAISTNMANVDTPGYHTQDIDFQAEFNRAISTPQGDGENGGMMQLEPAAREVPGLMERADGNNVDLDREAMAMSQVQLQYQLGIQLIRSQFHTLLSAIKDGN
jgi:flagellar basal-body rod protein FlgB